MSGKKYIKDTFTRNLRLLWKYWKKLYYVLSQRNCPHTVEDMVCIAKSPYAGGNNIIRVWV